MGLPEELTALDLSLDLSRVPLSELFERSRTIHAHLGAIPESRDGSMPVLQTALSWLRECESRLVLLGVFSPNEDADDLATGDVKYVLVPFYMAEILAASRAGDPTVDRKTLQKALQYLAAFLQRCRQYDLFGEVVPEAEESGAAFDAHAKRTQKVARFKRAREIEKQIKKLQSLWKNIDKYEKDAEESSHVHNIDEEIVRRTWLLTIELATAKALDGQQVLRQEVEILKMMEERGDGRQRAQTQPEAPSQSPLASETLQRLTTVGARMAGQDRRQEIRSQVFQPSHILPTVTVEQQTVKEWKEALALEQRQQASNQKECGEREDAGTDGEGDVYKQRAWDDWKDDHPRGYGNSKLRPCAQ